ncbi:DUF320 domain-containing protein [Actinoallomurus purpureus]|uniref:chaplin family protein n=1 Tax=Actinoallomurus purpureus TaxID=478114 RepID=UPI002093E073|nr:chaplin family protein [Actinoallomurus purpureus]MCO6010069.1 DUF320 domain-containing protein [Actinoallomurus purpureus]
MRKWTVRAARALLVGAAFAAAGAGIANADTTSGDHSLLGGTQIPVTAPNLLAGNALNVLSSNSSASTGSTQRFRYSYHRSRNIEATSLGGGSVGSGNQVSAPVSAPILICGNAIAADGLGTATCHGSASISSGSASQASSACSACAQAPAQPAAPACPAACAPAQPAAPVCSDACAAPQAPTKPVCSEACTQVGAPMCSSACAQQSADSSQSQLLSNNQASVPVSAPITICGNAGAIRGLAAAACDGNASFTKGGTS